jgi:Domain of unknown function (DUF5655)
MARWECPDCGREVGNRNQGHVCAPGVLLDEVFEGRPPVQRELYDVMLAHLESLGGVHADAVRVGVFWKTDRKLAEIRPMARALSVQLTLPREVDTPITRVLRASSEKFVHIIRVNDPDEIDDELLGWLTEAYDYATD